MATYVLAAAYFRADPNLGLPSDDAPYLWFRSGQVVGHPQGAATAGQLVAAAESLTR